jgi:hypothetical protein
MIHWSKFINLGRRRAGDDAEPDLTKKKLVEAYQRTPELIEKDQEAGRIFAVLQDPELNQKPVSLTVTIAPGVAMMFDYLHSKGLLWRSGKPFTLQEFVQAAASKACQVETSRFGANEVVYPYYLDVWNRVCDEEGHPERKVSTSDMRLWRPHDGDNDVDQDDTAPL